MHDLHENLENILHKCILVLSFIVTKLETSQSRALVINGFLTFWARLQGHLLIFCLDLAKCDHSDIICYFLWETYLAKYFQTSVRHTNQWRVIKIFSFIVILHKRSAESKQHWSEHSRHQFTIVNVYNCCYQALNQWWGEHCEADVFSFERNERNSCRD